MSRTLTDLRRALSYLDGEPAGRGRYSYVSSDEGRPARYTLDSADWRKLGAALRRGEPDAYSLWCAATCADCVWVAP